MTQDPDQQAPRENGSVLLEEIAAKERRLLELREATRLAERDLRKLKHKWARHELLRKRVGEANFSVLDTPRPSPTKLSPCSLEESANPVSGKAQQCLETSSEGANAIKSPRTRKLFENGRHMRAISLLSDLDSLEGADSSEKRLLSAESSTKCSSARENFTATVQVSALPSILSNSRQIAEEIRGGFLTFLDDIRQVTIGDEAKSMSPRERIDRDLRPLNNAENHYKVDLDAHNSASATKDEYSEEAEL